MFNRRNPTQFDLTFEVIHRHNLSIIYINNKNRLSLKKKEGLQNGR